MFVKLSGNLIYKIIFVFLSTLLLFLSYYPIYRNFQTAPGDRFYFGGTDYPLDMMGNLASVYEGNLGHLLRTSKATSTIESPPQLMKFEYILIGQLARITRTDPIVMFFATRLIVSLFYLWFIGFILIPKLFKMPISRVSAAILILFANGILPAVNNDNLRILLTMPNDIFVFQRMTTAAHHYILGSFLSLLAVYYFSRSIEENRKISLFYAAFWGFLASYVFVPAMILIYLALPLFLLFRLYQKPYSSNKKEYSKLFFQLFIFIVISVLPVFYLRHASQFFEFNTFANTEKIAPFAILPSNYLLLTGAVFIFGLFSIRRIIKRGNVLESIILSLFLIHPLAVFTADKFFLINRIRFFFTAYFIFMAVLATLGIEVIAALIKKKYRKFPILLVFGILVFLILFLSRHNFRMSYDRSKTCFCTVEFFDYGYPKKEVMSAIFYLKENSREDDIVLSGYYAGVLIPAFSGNRVYTSWWQRLMQTENLSAVSDNLHRFYKGEMDNDEALAFVNREKIVYVFFGDEERLTGKKDKLDYSFLKTASKKGDTLLYRVNL